MNRPVYQAIASLVDARLTCIKNHNSMWKERHTDKIKEIVSNLPSGSGIDIGPALDFDRSDGEKLVLFLEYHHMDEHGGYAGWTDHTLTVRPSLQHGIRLTISGQDKNDTKDYLHEIFVTALLEETNG